MLCLAAFTSIYILHLFCYFSCSVLVDIIGFFPLDTLILLVRHFLNCQQLKNNNAIQHETLSLMQRSYFKRQCSFKLYKIFTGICIWRFLLKNILDNVFLLICWNLVWYWKICKLCTLRKQVHFSYKNSEQKCINK